MCSSQGLVLISYTKLTPEGRADLLAGRTLTILAVRVRETALYYRPLLGIGLVEELLLQTNYRRLILVHVVG